jgi:hypothetical protein
MGRARVAEPRSEQLLVRLTAAEMEVLEAIAHLERVTPNQYARELLQHHVATLAQQPHVKADLANRAAYDAELASTATLSDLRAGTVVASREGADLAVARTNGDAQ